MLITNAECLLLQVGNFNHYKALYILVETYIRERDAQNPYDYYYSPEDEEGTNNEQGARQTRDHKHMMSLKMMNVYGLQSLVILSFFLVYLQIPPLPTPMQT